MISENENLLLLILGIFPYCQKSHVFPPALKIVVFLSVSLFSACREELSTGSPLSQFALDVDYSEGCEQARGRERAIERQREREAGREGGGYVAASLQHLSPDSHSQSTGSTAISSSSTNRTECFNSCS